MIDKRLVLLLFCVAVFFTRCTKDDIPSTPDGPFLFTSIQITKNTTPAPFTSLTTGQAVNFKVGVAYTLDPQDQKNINNVVLNLDFDAVDSSFAYVEEIGGIPDSTIALNASATGVTIPITATTPGTGPAYVRITAELSDSDTTFIVRDRQYWPLK